MAYSRCKKGLSSILEPEEKNVLVVHSQCKEGFSFNVVDIISNLPDCIKHEFLIRLPIKEAVMTCVLSKSWRYTWCTIPDLKIESNGNSNSHQNMHSGENSTIIDFIDQLLSYHKGDVHRFKLSGIKLDGIHDKWLQILSEKHIKELTIEPSDDNQWSCINRLIFSCLELKILALRNCTIITLLYFDGFRQLHTLHLMECIVLKSTAKLISFCPVLENLKFAQCFFEEKEVISIDAPNLQELTICGHFSQLFLLTPKLRTINFVDHASVLEAAYRKVEIRGNLIQLPIHIDHALIPSCFTCILHVKKDAPTLKRQFTMVLILSSARCSNIDPCFQAFPALQKLIVYLDPGELPYNSNAYESQDKSLPCLREVVIIRLPNTRMQVLVEFVEIILSKAPLLERLTIRSEMKDCEVSKLNQIGRLSIDVDIILDTHILNDEGRFLGCCCSNCNVVIW